ncbi:MAG: GNAT family N-acetyltransferase [Pseudomonadota bacterium]
MLSRDIRLTTPRLILRPTEPADAPRMAQIQSNWNVTRMLRLAPWPATEEAMFAWADLHGKEWAQGTAYRFAVLLNEVMIGTADIDDISGTYGEIGYWFDEPYWGQGYAGEAAAALMDFAIGTVGLKRIVAGHNAENPASGAVLKRLGFHFVEDTMKFSKPQGVEVPYRMYAYEV